MKSIILFVFLIGLVPFSWGQWSTDLSQNTRVTTNGSTCFGALADDEGGVLVVWGETTTGGATMYAQRYRADGTILIPKKALFSDPRSADCTKNAFTAVQLLRADKSDDIYVVFSLRQDFVYSGLTGTYTEFLQYQILSLSTCNTKIPDRGNQNKGHNLGYNYGDNSTSALRFRSRFIQDNGRVLVVWQQKNNPSDANRGGGGTLANGTDIRMAVLDVNDLNGPVAYRRDDATGDQTFPIFYARASFIFIAYRNNGNRLYVKRFSLTGSTIAPAWTGGIGGARDIGDIPNTETPIVAIQTKLTDSGEMVVYSVGDAVGLSAPIRAHRFDMSGTVIGQVNIITPNQFGAVNAAGAQLSAVTTFFFTKNGRQNIQRYEGIATRSAETPISQVASDGDATFSGTKVSGYTGEQYLVVGKNGGNGSKELYGQFIRFLNDTDAGDRLWGNNGKLVTSANSDKSFWTTFGLSNKNTFFIWKDQRTGTGCDSDVYCQVLDEQGNLPIKPEIKNVRLSKKTFCNAEIDAGTNRTFTVTFTATPPHNTPPWAAFVVKYKLLNSSTPETNVLGSIGGGSAGSVNTINATIPQGRGNTRWVYLVYVEGTGSSTPVLSEPSIDTLVIEPPSPKPIISSPLTLCTGAVANPLTAMGTNLKWYTAPTGGTGSSTAPAPITTTAGTTSYYVTQSTNGCESTREEIRVTVTSTPTISATANGVKPFTACGNTTVALTATAGFTSYKWSGPNIVNDMVQSPQLTTPTSGIYTVRGTSMCGTATDSVRVTINITPAPTVPSSTVSYCTGQPAMPLTATGMALKWYSTLTGGMGSSATPTPTTTVAGTTSYFVTQTLNNCESSPRTEIKVAVAPTPIISATANGNKSFVNCGNTAVTLSASAGFMSYKWSGPNNFDNMTQSPQLSTPISGTYTVTGTSTCGIARDSVRVIINPIPIPNASSSKSTYIVGETIQLNSGSGTGYTYLWTGPGFSSSETRQNPTILNATTAMTGDYTVTITANGCTARGTVNITVTTQPVTGIDNVSATSLSACPGAGVDVNFTIIPSNGVGTFDVYLADANGQQIGASIGTSTRSPIRATIPTTATAGTNYRLLVKTSPNISKSSSSAFTILQRATAQMLSPTKDTSIVARKTGDNLSARVRVQGSGPFTLTFSAGTRTVRNAGDTTLTFRFENDGVFSFQGINGACGAGGLSSTQNVRITIKRVVAIEEDTLAKFTMSVFPNPTSDRLTVQIKNGKVGQTTQLRLYDGKGTLIKTHAFYSSQHQWEMEGFPAGNYLLEVANGDKKQSFRVIKE